MSRHWAQAHVSARYAFDSAQRQWGASEDDADLRAACLASMRVLYWQSVRESLTALTSDGRLARWAEPAVFEAEAVPEVRAIVSAARVASLASGIGASDLPEADCVEARRIAQGLLAVLERTAREKERSRVQCLTRIGTIAGAGLVLAGVTTAVLFAVLQRPDLAPGHPFRTSSQLPNCFPEQGVCAGVKLNILFHTTEEDSPWYELDLEKPTRFSGVTAVNRQDAGLNRAVPMVIEVDDDQKTWKTVAERKEAFDTWRARFPEVTARYLRLRVTRRTQLHLQSVHVHP